LAGRAGDYVIDSGDDRVDGLDIRRICRRSIGAAGTLGAQGCMVLRGDTVRVEGATVIDEIVWERADGGRVRQVWRKSTDGGTDWQVVFNGLYTKVR